MEGQGSQLADVQSYIKIMGWTVEHFNYDFTIQDFKPIEKFSTSGAKYRKSILNLIKNFFNPIEGS